MARPVIGPVSKIRDRVVVHDVARRVLVRRSAIGSRLRNAMWLTPRTPMPVN